MNVGIIGTGSYVPERVVGNRELADSVGVDESWIFEKTRINERRAAANDQATSDLATLASKQAMTSAGIRPSDIDAIILASGSIDQPVPATACFVQANLGAYNSFAFDVMAVCAGFLYGLKIARDLLVADQAVKFVLVIGSEAHRRLLNDRDPTTNVLPGDGAGAVVVGRTKSRGILAIDLGTDGSFAQLAQIQAGGSRLPATAETVAAGLHHPVMQGRQVRTVTSDLLPSVVLGTLKSGGVVLSEVDLFVPHQANGVMMREWANVLGIDPHVIHQTIERYGNTGAASIPITLDDAARKGRVADGDLVLSVAFGAGISWGCVALEWAS